MFTPQARTASDSIVAAASLPIAISCQAGIPEPLPASKQIADRANARAVFQLDDKGKFLTESRRPHAPAPTAMIISAS
jgi:hypothetical protein